MSGGVTRRAFLARGVALAAAATVTRPLLGRALLAQQAGVAADTEQEKSAASNVAMDQGAVRPVRKPPKPGVRGPSMTDGERDAVEHQIGCQCGCTLSVYTCRTTDFSCQVSPAMHRDVMALVAGGYSAQEILDAFVETYGERVLLAPKKQGFNWAAYVAPFAALGAGAIAVAALIRRWGRQPAPAGGAPARPALHMDATPEELARLDAAVREDER